MNIDDLISELIQIKSNSEHMVPINTYVRTPNGLTSMGLCEIYMDDDGDLIIDTTKYDKDDEE